MGICSSNSGNKNQKQQGQVVLQQMQSRNWGENFAIGPDIFVTLKQGSISQQYSIERVLGEGAFGCVRLVTQKSTGNKRAMKQLRKDKILKEDEELMFAEVNILKELDHPNIVKLYELYQDDKNYYLITEFLEGGELFQQVKEMKNFSEKMAAEYMKQIFSAVQYCHDRKIVHRDLKPENILLENKKDDANLKIIDFGTCRKLVGDQKITEKLGTPCYIAPEVLKRQYDEKCDIWSCGVILYVLLCGYPPFNGADAEEILRKIEYGKFEFDRKLLNFFLLSKAEEWANISNEAKSFIRKLLRQDPTLRPTAQQAFNDPWIQKNSITKPLDPKALKQLGDFQAKSKIKQFVMQFIAAQVMSNKEKETLLNTFKGIDKNGDGQLCREELMEGYRTIYDEMKCQQIVDEIFQKCDSNFSGSVDFTEFIVAASQFEELLNKEKLQQTFKIFDAVYKKINLQFCKDGSGQISKEELQEIIGGVIDEQQWLEILAECDKDGNGLISEEEFIDMLSKKVH